MDAVTLLGQARRALDAVRRHDTEIDGVAARLSEAAYLVSEVAGELASYIQGIDADPARLAAVQERRAALARVIRLYGPGGVSARHQRRPGHAARRPRRERRGGGQRGAARGRRRREPDDIAYVLEWARLAAARVLELDNDDDTIAALTAEEARAGRAGHRPGRPADPAAGRGRGAVRRATSPPS